jgi:hypothetical protein
MAHVTMIHGIGQKPTAEALIGIWRPAWIQSIRNGLASSLDAGPGGLKL